MKCPSLAAAFFEETSMSRTDPTRRLLLGALALAAAPALRAQSAPPLRLLVGVPAGSATDLVARILADGLQQASGQTVIVENRPGGIGTIATTAFLSAPADGSTWLLAVNGFFSEAPYSVKMRFDPLADVRPLVEVGGNGLVLVGDAALPPRTLPELVAWVKARPGQVSYASYSPGSLSHVLGLLLNQAAGLDMLHVGYRGSPPALQDVMGGRVQFMFDAPPTSVPMVRAGKLRAFAVTSPQRLELLPDVPTLAELGYPALTRTAWIGLFTTPAVPAAVQQRMRSQLLQTMALPAIRQRLREQGIAAQGPEPASPDDLARRLAADHAAIGQTLKAIHYQPE